MKYIITGSSSGLGFALAEKLVLRGDVIGISRLIGKGEKLTQSGRFHHISYDLSGNLRDKLYLDVEEKLCKLIDNEPCTLILNAASFYKDAKRLDHSLTEKMFSVNVFSSMALVRSLEVLKLRRILIINSISGLIGQSEQHEYCASKHALMGFVKSLIKSAKHSEYDVMCINPGGMKTELWGGYSEVQTEDFLNPAAVAEVCLGLITFPQRAFIESFVILPPSDV